MKQQYTTVILLLLALTLPSQTQICSLPSSSSDLLQSGVYSVQNRFTNNPLNREHSYSFTVNFPIPAGGIQVAASASMFQVVATNGMDFAIWGGQGNTGNTGIIYVLLNQDNTWTTVKISYLASARSDFVLGTFSVGTYFSQAASSNGDVTISHIVPGWTVQSSGFRVIVEISGLKTYSSAFQAIISAVSMNPSNGMIIVDMRLISSPPIESVVISYVVFSQTSPLGYVAFSAAQGSTLPYQFLGMDSVQSGSSVVVGNGFTSASQNGITCIGSRCQTTCISALACQSSQGQVIGSKCLLCLSTEVIVDGQCVARNSCGAFKQRNTAGVCVCIQNYREVNGICYRICAPNAVIMNFQCQCIPGYVLSVSNGCVPRALIDCRPNFVVENGVCVCPTGFGIINNDCVVCPSNSYVNQNRFCVCNNGYTLNTTSYTCQLNCQANAYRNSFGQCVCNNGYYMQNNICIPQGTCNGQLVWNGSHCVCPAPQINDTVTGGCIICNQVGRRVINGVCVCAVNYYPTSNGCFACTPNSEYDTNAGRCICKPGYTQDANGNCNRNCVNSTWNGNACVCWNGYYIINGVCQKCDPNSRYSSTAMTCVCVDGFYGTWAQCFACDSSCKTCSGAGANRCSSCHTGLVSNGACSNHCGSGFYKDANNNCQSCLANCEICYNSVTCTRCQAGFTRKQVNNGGSVITTCEAPAATASHVLTLRGRVLGNQVIYQGVAFNTLPQAILTDGCNSCSTLFQVDTNSLFTTVTSTQQFVTNSQYWFIITFNYFSSTAVPTFEFTIRINPTHPYAYYFSSQDLAQSLSGAFSPDSFAVTETASPMIINADPSRRQVGPGGYPTVGVIPNQITSEDVPQSIVDQIFA